MPIGSSLAAIEYPHTTNLGRAIPEESDPIQHLLILELGQE